MHLVRQAVGGDKDVRRRVRVQQRPRITQPHGVRVRQHHRSKAAVLQKPLHQRGPAGACASGAGEVAAGAASRAAGKTCMNVGV